MRYVIDPAYFKEAILEIGQPYIFYTRDKVEVNEYGEIENIYKKIRVWGSLQPESNSRNEVGQAGTVEQNYNFYCESKYRIYIDDIIESDNGDFLQIYEYQNWDAFGVRELKCKSLKLSENRDLKELISNLSEEEIEDDE